MKREHFEHVLETFSTSMHSAINLHDLEVAVSSIRELYVEAHEKNYNPARFRIVNDEWILFMNIKTLEEAERILQYIKDTEVLFL